MSFALGFYEIFSYAIPGFLYILVANGFLQLFNLPYMDLGQVEVTFGFVVLMTVLSYLAGHIFEPFGYWWYRLFNRGGIDKAALGDIKGKYPGLKIEFDVQDRRMLYSFIKHNDLALAEYLDQFHAVGVFLHNASFAIVLFALTQIAYIFRTGELLKYGAGASIGLLLSFIAVKRSAVLNRWYFLGIFEQALHYGTSVEMMFKEAWPGGNPPPTPGRKPRERVKPSETKAASTKAARPATSRTRTTKKKGA